MNHLLALQPTDEADDDRADEKADPGVEQHLVEQLGFGDALVQTIRVGELFGMFSFPEAISRSPAVARAASGAAPTAAGTQ